MVARVRFEQLCDLCWGEESEETLAEEKQSIQLDGKPLQLDLCTAHNEKSYGSIEDTLDVFRTYGHPAEEQQRRQTRRTPIGRPTNAFSTNHRGKGNGETYQCPKCDAAPYTSKMYFEAHLKRHEGPPYEHACDYPECSESYPTNQQLGLHKSRRHGILGVNAHRKKN